MINSTKPTVSFVVPLYNEGAGLEVFHQSLLNMINKSITGPYEIIYCDDGSSDNTTQLVLQWHHDNSRIKLIKLSRNFGKENALTAGIAAAKGEAIITLDGDGQHPVELIPQFLQAWKTGAAVVIGVRNKSSSEGLVARLGSRMFYKLFNSMTGQKLLAGSTDFRLIDRSVQQAFLQLQETDRLTRGLIDWLGFKRAYIYFDANARVHGESGYSRRMLAKLAMNSFVSLTPKPLYFFGYIGVVITLVAFIMGTAIMFEQLLLQDPLGWRFTGTAMLSILVLFLVGMVLMSQGILSLYISHIHSQSKHRPLYIIDYKGSVGIRRHEDSPE